MQKQRFLSSQRQMSAERVAIYCRLSEEDRNKHLESDDSGSIQNQKLMLLQYAAAQDWEVYDVYSDDDYTGADRRRPEFLRLLQDARVRRFDIVLCKTQSRFTRELELVEKYIHGLFPLWGIRFVSIVDNADTANRGNKKSRQINGLVNEWYLEDMSENIRSVLDTRRRNGLHIGSFALYGYQKDPDKKGHLLVDEPAATVVREVFTLFVQGYGKTAIARHLNKKGIPSPGAYKCIHGLAYHNPKASGRTLWSYSAISSMLRNEIYIGNMVQGKYGSVSYKSKQNRPRPRDSWYVVEGTHTPIISLSLWKQVQAILLDRARPNTSGEIGIFAGKVRCMSCGGTLRSSKNRGRHYLQCRSRYLDTGTCPGAFIAVRLLEELVLRELEQLSSALLDRELLLEAVGTESPLELEEKRAAAAVSAAQRGLAAYSTTLRDLYLDKTRGLLDEYSFHTLLTELNRERSVLEAELRNGEVRLKYLNSLERSSSPSRWVDWCLHPARLTRDMAVTLIDYISVGKKLPGARVPPVEIHWNF